MAKRLKAKRKSPPPAMSDESAKLIADAAVGLFNWIRATPARTAGALLVAGLVGAVVVDGLYQPSPPPRK